ncbi:MAG: 2-oxoacid:acceptor oxidoreductase family protein [Thermodesulfobacteriota bacterium]
MQIAITGRGGQGVLFLTRILGECALRGGAEVIASETHGMAQRGGSVISTLKIGPFRGPLIRSGQADLILALDEGEVETFAHFLSAQGTMIVNSKQNKYGLAIDATRLAAQIGSPLMANLVLLGFALQHKKLFCNYELAAEVVKDLSPERYRQINGQALKVGFRGNIITE